MDSDDLDVLIHGVLERVGKGLSAHQVHGKLPRPGRPSRAAVAARVQALAAAGKVHAWPGGKTPLFGAAPYEAALRAQVEHALEAGPRTEAQLRKGVPPEAHPLVRRVLDEMLRAGRAHLHPKLRGRDVFAAEPADPLPVLRPFVEDAIRKAVKKGFREEDVRAALRRLAVGTASAPEPDATELIRAVVLELNPRAAHGALVYVPHVRVAVGDRLDKGTFDRTLLAMLAQERVQLQAHPVPSQLNADERSAMVPDGRGSYYMAVGLR